MSKISQLPELVEPTGAETVPILVDGVTKRATMGPLVEKAAAPIVSAIGEQVARSATFAETSGVHADRAGAAALGALLAVADGVYETPEAGLEDHAADGSQAYFAIDDDSSLALVTNEGGTPERKINIATHQSLRENGIDLAREIGSNLCLAVDPTDVASDWKHIADTINDVIDTASAWGVGVINCGGARRLYTCGGDQVIHGVASIQPIGSTEPYDVPFKRGQLMANPAVEMRGNSIASRPKFLAAPEHDPGPLFGQRWWDEGRISNFALTNLDLDGNEENYTVSAYDLGVENGPMWIQGHAIALLEVDGLTVRGCRIHGWWGHGVFGGSRNFELIGNEFFNNMQGGTQVAVERMRSIRNWFHGDGGWTAVGENLEVGAEGQMMIDILLADNVYDMRDGLSTTIATAKQFATNSQAALDARRRFRRALWLSGNYYTAPHEFARTRGRVRIVRPTVWQGCIGGGGFDRIHVLNPMIENTFEARVIQWPVPSQAINFGTTAAEAETLEQLIIRDAQVYHEQPEGAAIVAHNFRDVDISGQFKGMRSAVVRLENCGGKVDITATDFGVTDDTAEFWEGLGQSPAQRGSRSAAVVMFGQLGPVDITVRANETRPEGQRGANLLAYINTGNGFVTTVRGSASPTIRGLDGDDELIQVVVGAVVDAGVYSPHRMTTQIRGDLTVGGQLTTPNLAVDNPAGDALLTFASPAGSKQGLTFTRAGELAGTIRLSEDGQVFMQVFADGAPKGTFSLNADGHIFMSSSWTTPLQLDGENFYWTDAGGKWRSKIGARPTSDADGSLVGDQTAGA